MKKYHIRFLPSQRQGETSEGKTIAETSRELGVEIESPCGGLGRCGKCKVKVEKATIEPCVAAALPEPVSPFQKAEGKFIHPQERADGYRLACIAQITGDALILVPEKSRGGRLVVRKGATERSFELNPAVASYVVELPAATFQDPSGDFERLIKALIQNRTMSPALGIDYRALLGLPAALRRGNWTVTVITWMEEKIIDIRPGRANNDIYGIAVDVGTTSVAAHLCQLRSGRLIATETMTNPQVAYGEDVMSRIGYVMKHAQGLATLHYSIIEGLNRLIQRLREQTGVSAEDIVEMTVVGNTVMHHLFFGIDPVYLGVPPFSPAIQGAINVPARDLGLKINQAANVYSLPLDAGFVGADTVGVLIAERPYHRQKMVLIVDVGTNGELVLGNKKKLIACSCATGPALEGAHIAFGMRAAPGAIERIKIDPDNLGVCFQALGPEIGGKNLNNSGAQGICGSGIIEGVAELFRNGVIDTTGRFNKNIVSPRLRINGGTYEFVIAWQHETTIGTDITITQRDVRSVQLAKAALYAGAKILMSRLGIKRIDQVTLAGAFGSCLDPSAAMTIGLFPDCDLKNVCAVGNAAGDGARLVLLDRKKRREAEKVAAQVKYVELTSEKEFQKEFLDAMYFPHKSDDFPHLRGLIRDDVLKR